MLGMNTSSTYTATLDNINGNTPANTAMTTATLNAITASPSGTDITVIPLLIIMEKLLAILSSSGSVAASGGPYTQEQRTNGVAVELMLIQQ